MGAQSLNKCKLSIRDANIGIPDYFTSLRYPVD